jgi:hypothetical protein
MGSGNGFVFILLTKKMEKSRLEITTATAAAGTPTCIHLFNCYIDVKKLYYFKVLLY